MLPKRLVLLLLPLAAASSAVPVDHSHHGEHIDHHTYKDPTTGQAMICHPELDHCYPKHFIPTTEFQTVYDDQDIPKGLHVRLNLETGLKEAKFNEGHDESNGIILVDSNDDDTIESNSNEPITHADSSSQGAIKPPKSSDPGTDDSFAHATSVLSISPPAPVADLLPALTSLEDLAHEIYWGTELSKHHFPTLLSLATSHSSPTIRASSALLLGSACSNNPAAIKAGLAHYPSHSSEELVKALLTALETEHDGKVLHRLVFALAQVVKDANVFRTLVEDKGEERIVGIFVRSKKDKVVRGKIAVLIQDAFLGNEWEGDGSLVEMCPGLQEDVMGKEAGEDVKEKMVAALVGLKKHLGGRCVVGEKFLGWVEKMRREAKGRGWEELVDEGEGLLAEVVKGRKVLGKNLEDL